MDIFFISGIVGGLLVLVAFFLTNWSGYNNDTHIHDEWANLIGAGLLIVYAVDGKVWPFVILNIIWAAWSLYRIGSFTFKRK